MILEGALVREQDCWGAPTYYGRRGIDNFLANVPMQCIPWQRFNIS